MARPTVTERSAIAERIAAILDYPEFTEFIKDIEASRWTGRPGYPVRSLVGACLAKTLYEIDCWSKVARLINEHEALQRALGGSPSVHALHRFKKKLLGQQAEAFARCIASALGSLRAEYPTLGTNVAIDATDLPAYSNSQPTRYKDGPPRDTFSDPDATTGKRSATSTRKAGFFFGYKLHLVVDTDTEIPIAWHLATAKQHESQFIPDLLLKLERGNFSPRTASLDSGYDSEAIFDSFHRMECAAVIPLVRTAKVKAGKHLPPTCPHGTKVFRGADYRRRATKWVCPTGECRVATSWEKASRLRPLIPIGSRRWNKIRSNRSSVERVNGRLKHEYALTPARTRGIKRVRLHTNLTILAMLADALYKARQATESPPLRRAA